MPVVPPSLNDRIEFYEQHAPIWKASPLLVGLSQAQADAIDLATKNARAAYNEALEARLAAKTATVHQNALVRTMTGLGSDGIRFIRAFAESQATPAARDAVYVAASLPPPAPPVPAGPPEPPTDVVGDPNADGTVTIRWKGSTANQTFFTLWRRVGNNTQWTQIGAVATKRFIDDTVPAGTPIARYYIRAQRNNQVSAASDEAIVNFGGQALAA